MPLEAPDEPLPQNHVKSGVCSSFINAFTTLGLTPSAKVPRGGTNLRICAGEPCGGRSRRAKSHRREDRTGVSPGPADLRRARPAGLDASDHLGAAFCGSAPGPVGDRRHACPAKSETLRRDGPDHGALPGRVDPTKALKVNKGESDEATSFRRKRN